ncbi:Transmembrane and tetratricopeptide repeat containing 3 [Paragonimus heterotremus]|uniref:dolichyl-phosphate-mannose--protein mannosyltransferase n=1 Tax=Paragonimus heterotremus TaxID=100268 RepID=A0A8J4WFZ1_9TREM|nr:Transmembrane and tetratricopeptide repeat containing 3 [Paragonimus heterotremus]
MKCWRELFVFTVAILVYLNSLWCGFVFDDVSAIKENQDLRPTTNWTDVFYNDFWGTPMIQERSHKSYRPITVLTFRVNYLLHELNPVGYHAFNVILHALVAVLLFRLSKERLTPTGALITSLYFAVHPIHTEAVTGVVGRAELLSAAISLSILLHYNFIRSSGLFMYWRGILILGSLLAVGTLCKEQAITVVGILCAGELILAYRSCLSQLASKQPLDVYVFGASITKWSRRPFKASHQRSNQREDSPVLVINRALLLTVFRHRHVYGLFALMACAVGVMFFRIRIMGSQLPHFTEFDNPAAHAQPLVRRLTHLYLVPVNLWLLFCPSGLCADWTLGSLRLITGWFDPRNIFTLLTFCILVFVSLLALYPKTETEHSKTLVIVSCTNSKQKALADSIAFFILITFVVKTIHRNFDWTDEYSLFTSALKVNPTNAKMWNNVVNPTNAKMWNNVGHALEAKEQFHQALGYFQQAVRVQPNDIGARINVGRTYVNLGMPREAEEAYFGALEYFPKPRKGETYYTRVAPKDLMVFINLANLYLNKTPPQLDDAARLLRRAISLRSDFVDAYQNYGSVLIKQSNLEEAEDAYRTALLYQQRNPDLYYNLGVVLLETGRSSDGVENLNKALLLKPDHAPSLFALASTLTDSTDATKREEGKRMLEQLASRDFETSKVNFALGMIETDLRNFTKAAMHYEKTLQLASRDFETSKVNFALGMIETDLRNFTKAAMHYEKTLQLDKHHRSALFNLALLSRNQLNDSERAVPLLERLIQIYPDHVKSYMLLGDIELTERKQPEVASKLFRKAVQLAPSNVQAKHNLCVALAEDEELEESEKCLLEAIAMAPAEEYLREHLAIVRKRLKSD